MPRLNLQIVFRPHNRPFPLPDGKFYEYEMSQRDGRFGRRGKWTRLISFSNLIFSMILDGHCTIKLRKIFQPDNSWYCIIFLIMEKLKNASETFWAVDHDLLLLFGPSKRIKDHWPHDGHGKVCWQVRSGRHQVGRPRTQLCGLCL